MPSPSPSSRGTKRSLESSPTPLASVKRLKTAAPSPRPQLTARRSNTPKVTPLMARYKNKAKPQDPLSALKKPLKRLTKAPTVTPAQVKPADLLKRKMRGQVETAITAKVAARPDSSPYTLDTTENNSPVFQKVEARVEQHLTGTPARAVPRSRKFGTTMQPSSLLDSSALPTGKRQSVSSSTPLRPCLATPSPHPLECVEATPIRPLAPSPARHTSPQPEVVTGGLGKMCSIM